MKKILFGIIGTGRIANRFVQEAVEINEISINAVYNPRSESSRSFALQHKINFFTDNMKEFMKRVDCVYIASPHETHFDYIKLALENRKHVMCEKPLVLNKSDAVFLYGLADKVNCILLEAIKTAYCPGFITIMKLLRQNVIGEIKDIEAAFTKLENINSRELTDIKYGGCFTELASYTLLPIIKVLGSKYKEIYFKQIKNDKNIDIYTKVYLVYDNAFATSKTGLRVKSDGQLLISGSKGYILVKAPWWKTMNAEICFENPKENVSLTFEYLGEGLRYEIRQFVLLIKEKKKNELITNEESIAIVELMERFLELRG